jgi:hypothetical protein
LLIVALTVPNVQSLFYWPLKVGRHMNKTIPTYFKLGIECKYLEVLDTMIRSNLVNGGTNLAGVGSFNQSIGLHSRDLSSPRQVSSPVSCAATNF